jgi:leucyl aminopeptidase
MSIVATIVAAACAAGCSHPDPAAPPETGPRYVTLDSDALAAARTAVAEHDHRLSVLDTYADVAVVELDASDLGALAEQVHQQLDRCGGFIVHDSRADAEHSARYAHTLDAARPSLDYTLDHPDEVRAVLPALDQRRIRDTIRELSAMQNRYYRSDSGAQASLWLRDRWRSMATRGRVSVELFETGYPQKSVIMTLPGTTRADEVIVIGAHLDSIAHRGNPAIAPGADDDASGVATVTEIARVLLASDYRPTRTIQFMAYAAEEVGLRGSLQIARDYQKRKVKVVGALQLDMTNNRGSDRDIWLMRDFTNAAQNAFLGRLIDTYTTATWGYDACGYACSDHAAWHRIGVPASMPFESRMRDGNGNIHSADDTLENSSSDAAQAIKFARLGAAYAIELGKGELRQAPPALAPDAAPATSAPTMTAATPGSSRSEHPLGHRAAAVSVMLLIASMWALRAALARVG